MCKCEEQCHKNSTYICQSLCALLGMNVALSLDSCTTNGRGKKNFPKSTVRRKNTDSSVKYTKDIETI